ncbi:SDR family NAD(P)-dependent oxidoreductase [Kitasatospora sp. NPDC051170]|uniref:SDR family NAD(P)-dependent oxidoreductase n=1 Tax=Kitasatospora sp. NPDC051170 TaxID=3364056 RepID=UPI003792BFCD
MSSTSEVEKLEAYLRRTATALVEAEKQLDSERAARTEPIAVVSMACRLPGGIDTPEGFWELLAAGGDAISGFPERWQGLDLFDPDPEAVGKSYATEGGFMTNVERFDAAFFGISPREAQSMDPQQRLVLETAWEALERAGVRPEALEGSRTGVYLGTMSSDYGNQQGHDLDALDGYVSTGNASSVVSGRVSYALGLQGPAVTVDTACSSSLVATHLAVSALRQGECEMALVGGVTVMNTPALFVEFSRLRGMAADGRCKSFGADADGAGWAEGCGVLVLKRLSAAERDGDRVLAVIRGTAINQDGRSQGLTAPNGPSQQRVIQDALATADLTPADIDAIEAHGTGTSLGDPIEAGALAEVFGPGRAADRPLLLGSSKSNIGHAQAAAGVIGVIKMVLALQHATLPRTLHASEPSPHIEWDGSGLALLQDSTPWQRGERARRAGVSSFGLSGTNAHVILEEAPESRPALVQPQPTAVPVVVSGRDEASVREQSARWADWLDAHDTVPLADVAVTAARHRTRFEHRAVVVAGSTADAAAKLRAIAAGEPVGVAGSPGEVVFVYPGQGSQWLGMGAALLEESPVFREAVVACDEALRPLTDWSVLDVLAGAGGNHPPVDRVDVIQPALFAMGVALSALWRSWGIEPSAVVGHSQGEVVAAVVSGALSLEQGAKVVALRSAAVRAVTGFGGMALVERPVAEVEEILAAYEGRLSVAAVNTPGSTVVSGESEAIDALVADLQQQDVFCRRVNVDYASHSAQMDPLLPGLMDAFADLTPGRASVPFYSTVLGRVLDGPELDGAYWCRNLREPVRFDRALEQLLADGRNVFVEVSAHPVLSMPLTDGSAEHDGVVVGSLARGEGGLNQLLRSLGQLHVQGVEIDWQKVLEGGEFVADLPTYAFQREYFWTEVGSGSADAGSMGLEASTHPWLGAGTALADGEGHLFTGRLAPNSQPWLRDHAAFGTVIVPGTGILDLVLAAGREVGAGRVEELALVEPLILDGPVRLQVVIGGPENGHRQVSLYSRPEDAEDSWTLNASGELAEEQGAQDGFDALRHWPVPTTESVSLDGFYDAFAARGLAYGPAFQGLTGLWRDGSTAYGTVRLPEGVKADEFGIHPALLDAALHTLVAVRDGGDQRVFLPFEWTGVELFAAGSTELRVRVDLDESGTSARIWVSDPAGGPVAFVDGLQIREASAEQVRAGASVDHLYRLDYQEVQAPKPTTAPSSIVLGGTGELARLLNVDHAHTIDALGEARPERAIVDLSGAADSVQPALTDALTLVQHLTAEPALDSVELVFVTRGATGTDPVQAALLGLLRTVRAEYADRAIRLLDLDTNAPAEVIERALCATGEPELAIVEGRITAPRLVRVTAADTTATVALNPDRTALITGGTGELGRELAEHLVRQHGVRHLVLTSRQGAEAPGAAQIRQALQEAGAETVRIAACDAAERDQLAAVVNDLGETLGSVFHLAAVLDDGLLTGQTPDRFARVLAPKVNGALHLHDLTRNLTLDAFVLFSSAAGVFGSAGQSAYAAANAFVDALATQRRAADLPALSLSWGLWQQAGTGLTAHLGDAELSRMRRQGIAALTPAQGLRALDAALTTDLSPLIPVRLELGSVRRELERGGEVPSLLRSLVRARLRRAGATAAAPSALHERLAALSATDRRSTLLDLVRREAAAVLGVGGGPEALGAQQVFKELGLDSLMAVELRRRLAAETGLTLPSTLAFDYPTPTAIAGLILDRLDLGAKPDRAPVRVTPGAGAQTDDPIAVVSMACRLPGGIDTPEGFWDLLLAGGDAIGGFPQRWQGLDLFDPDPDAVGKSYAREGGFLENVDRFDAAFFGISPREAQSMDPQQRLVLETVWEALERAGVRPGSLEGTRTGVYLGAMSSDYGSHEGRQLEVLDGYMSTGNASSVVSGRVSYALGLQGPAVTVDTACSSSLVATHLAVSALRQGECEMALVGGVTVMNTPALFVEFSRLKGMASDGRCKSFGADADGAGWAEGCGVLVLKRLSAAERDGDEVLAVIRGSAINQDGRSQGLTAPNGPSQQRVIQDALATADLTPADIDAIEAHGTGTSLGDPIEAGALAEVFGPGRAADRPLLLGSSKSNIGHAQAAAGVIGVIKMVLALQHATLPRTLHASEPSPHIEWDGSGLALLQDSTPWQRGDRTRRAGVSSFGLSGTNAHLILEEAPTATHPAEPSEPAGPTEATTPLPVLLSGRDETALREQAARWADWLDANPETPLAAVAATAAHHRTHFDHRAAVLAATTVDTATALRSLAEGRPAAGTVANAPSGQGLAVLFTGQGSQRLGMGRGLYESDAAFRSAFDTVLTALDRYSARPLLEVIFGEDADTLNRTEFTQPALFAVEVALFRLWESWGLAPAAVAGHSVGELAAAHVAGVLSLDDAARLVVARGRLMQSCESGGAMASVEAGEEEVLAVLQGRISVAGVNSPTQTVVSGDAEAVERLIASMPGRRSRRLQVSHAFHSPHMDAMLEEFTALVASCELNAPRIPLVSTLDGTRMSADLPAGEGVREPAYWARQARQAVRFLDAVRELNASGIHRFLECGPSGVLSAMGAACLDDALFVPTLRATEDEPTALLTAAATLHTTGEPIDWTAVIPNAGVLAALPTYAFQRRPYWLDAPKAGRDARSSGLVAAAHPWLAAVTALAGGEGYLLSGRVSLADQPWLGDHAVFGAVLVPGAGLLDLALSAAQQVGARRVAELMLAQPMVLPAAEGLRLQVKVGPAGEDGGRTVEIHSQPESAAADAPWTLHAEGRLAEDGTEQVAVDQQPWPAPGTEPVPLDALYDGLAGQGLGYGPAFRGLTELHRAPGGRVAFGRVVLPEGLSADGHAVHPALLDAALHTLAGVEADGTAADGAKADGAKAGADAEEGTVLLPFAWSDVTLHATDSTELRVRVELTGGLSARVEVTDAAGGPVLVAGTLEVQRARAEQLRGAAASAGAEHLYRVEFQPLPQQDTGGTAPDTVVLGAALAASLGLPAEPDLEAVLTRPAVPARLLVDGTRESAVTALEQVKLLVGDVRFAATEVVWLTRGAVPARPEDEVARPEQAALWGLLRSVRAEHPERRLRLLDLDPDGDDGPEETALALALAVALAVEDEPELAVRGTAVLTPRLRPVRTAPGAQAAQGADPVLLPPPGVDAWHLDIREKGRLDTFALVPVGDGGPLGEHEIRLRVHASGLNFRDVLNALDMVHAPQLGLECAGVVLETGPGIAHLNPGDRVMGLTVGTFGTEARADGRMMVRIPDGIGFAEAATVPLAFLTAYHGLLELGGLTAGERVLVHAAAGGVGMAAVQLARHFGAEVWGTASAGKWPTLRRLGLARERIASSRDTGFETAFHGDGSGFDLVLNSLTGELIDASLRLLEPRAGRFLEMGKTDVRQAEQVAATHPGVSYRAFDLMDAGPERILEMLTEVADLLARRVIAPLPYAAYDVRRAADAFRFMAQGRHIGKLVLTSPRPLAPTGTVLVTGGTGELGRLVARRLVTGHGVRHLVLTSRRGPAADGTRELVDELRAAGAESVRVLACDVADRAQVAAALAAVDPGHPLTGVVHLAAVLDDGVVVNQTAERFGRVLAPKADGARHLHELTDGLDLAAFVLFSSVAGTLGSPGQSNYAAANAYLDALAAHRTRRGLPGTSLAWGLWEQGGTGLTAHLGEAELGRMRRQGAQALSVEQGLALFDAALGRPEPHLVPLRLDLDRLQRGVGVEGAELPPLLRALLRTPLRRAGRSETAAAADGLRERLAGLDGPERIAALTLLVQQEVAAVLGLSGIETVRAEQPLRDHGWDSLMAVELRNRLSAHAQVPLPSTLAFDYPTPQAIADFLNVRLDFGAARAEEPQTQQYGAPPQEPEQAARWALSRIPADELSRSGLLAQLLELAGVPQTAPAGGQPDALRLAEELTIDEMDQALDAVLGRAL